MNKVPKDKVFQDMIDDDIWDQDWETIDDDYWLDYWGEVAKGEMTWQWYMKLANNPDWHYVVINPNHKYQTVKNWLAEHYPGCNYEQESHHFIFEDEAVATVVALKWA